MNSEEHKKDELTFRSVFEIILIIACTGIGLYILDTIRLG